VDRRMYVQTEAGLGSGNGAGEPDPAGGGVQTREQGNVTSRVGPSLNRGMTAGTRPWCQSLVRRLEDLKIPRLIDSSLQ